MTIKSQGLMNTDYSKGYLCACSICKAMDVIPYYKAFSTISVSKNDKVPSPPPPPPPPPPAVTWCLVRSPHC